MDTRKRGRPEANANGGPKKFKQETESLSTGVGSKSKPCTKFYSTAGCPFGEGCHFQHYVPGGYNAVAQMMNLAPAAANPPPPRNMVPPPPMPNGSSQQQQPPTVKNRMCNKYNTAEGCKFGDSCRFAHGEWELGKAVVGPPPPPFMDDPRSMGMGPIPGGRGMMHHLAPPLPGGPGPASSFGASATAKISVDASLAGAIIGKGGVNSKQICRQTGAKLSIRDHETDPNQRSIELEGTFEQIQQASVMVKEIIANIGPGRGGSGGHHGGHGHGHDHGGGGPPPPGNNFKTKLCDNFTKGSCTFGDRCHFAHGAAELRKTVV